MTSEWNLIRVDFLIWVDTEQCQFNYLVIEDRLSEEIKNNVANRIPFTYTLTETRFIVKNRYIIANEASLYPN